MKVVHLNTYTEGGAAEAALRLHSALLQAGVDSKFVALYKGKCTLKEVYDFRDELSSFEYWRTKITNKCRSIVTKNLSLKAGELYSEINSVWKAEQHSLINNADIVHLHWVSGYVNLPTFFKHNYKVVWTLHDHFLFSGGFHFPPPVQNVVSEKTIETRKQIIRSLLTKHPIEIVCPSEHLTQMVKMSGVLSKCNFHTIKNAVDTKTFRPLTKEQCRNKLKISINKKVLFFLSDYIDYPRKGFSILKEALHLINQETILLVAGRGNLPSEIGKVKVVHFGLVSDKTLLNELYNACDILVTPSLNDVTPNTIIEAMACGRPVVAFKTGGIPELITDLNGLMANEKTAAALADAITNALNNNYDASAIANKAVEEHAPELISQKYSEVYRNLLKK